MTHSDGSLGRNDGVVYARTRDGVELPVIDVTNPRFTVPDDPAAAQRASEALAAEERRRRRIPKFIIRLMLRAAARKSRLVRALFASDSGYLDSLSTYVMKLGADNLVLADTNEEGANMLALQTRQQLSIQALSLASQANQAVLRLFG